LLAVEIAGEIQEVDLHGACCAIDGRPESDTAGALPSIAPNIDPDGVDAVGGNHLRNLRRQVGGVIAELAAKLPALHHLAGKRIWPTKHARRLLNIPASKQLADSAAACLFPLNGYRRHHVDLKIAAGRGAPE